MLTNHAIPSLIGGVSQQPAIQRHPTQVESLVNFVPSVASGLRRRVGSMYGAKLGTTDWSNAFVHAINRGTVGTTERYFVIIDQGDLAVYDWYGSRKTVNFPDGLAYLSTFPNGAIARDIFGAVTVADYTFIVNKTIATAMEPHGVLDITPAFHVVIKVGVAKTRYYISLDGTTFSYETTDDTGYKTDDVAIGLKDSIETGGGYTVQRYGSVLVITKNDSADFQGTVADSYGDQALFGFKDTVNRYEELPRRFYTGRTIEIKGDPNNSNDSWYVEWKKEDNNADGVWIETARPNIDQEIWPDGMPWQLVRNSDGTFTFQKAVWDQRVIGDDNSNPPPSFIGSPIADVFFFRNRLGFLADENVILSQAGQYFNFWATSARTDTDADPIDISAATTKVTFLRHALPFEKSMLILADNQQFQLSSGDALTQRTAKLDPTTAFSVSKNCRPMNMGRNVYFATDRGSATSVREYYFDGNSITSDASDVSAHCPSFVPPGAFRMTTATTEDVLFVQSSRDRNMLYVYNSFWNGEEKVQSAWHKWEFAATDIIISADVFATTMALIVKRPDGVYLDWLELEEHPYSPVGFPLCLDRWTGYASGTYDSAQNRTFWTLPWQIPDGVQPRIVLQSFGSAMAYGNGIQPQQDAPNMVSLKGNHSTTTVAIGIEYESYFEMSQQFYRDQKDQPVANARLQLRDLTLYYDKTGYFEVLVSREAGADANYDLIKYAGRKLGTRSAFVGFTALDSGSLKVPLMASSNEVYIRVSNRTHFPSTFMAAEWQGNVAMQARRQ